MLLFFFSSRRRHTRLVSDWSSDVCSSDLSFESCGNGYPQLSNEYVLAANPDLVVLSDTKCCAQTAKTVAARPGWSNVAAVRGHGVIGVSDDIASRWGPRIVDFVRIVAAAARRSES